MKYNFNLKQLLFVIHVFAIDFQIYGHTFEKLHFVSSVKSTQLFTAFNPYNYPLFYIQIIQNISTLGIKWFSV